MIVIYALCMIPFLMLPIILMATRGKVRDGEYGKSLVGTVPRTAPPPGAAVATVVVPFGSIIVVAAYQGTIGLAAIAVLTLLTLVFGRIVYSAASKRFEQNKGTE